MPYKDPEKRIEHNKEWRKSRYTSNYMKWIYARREFRFWKAAKFEEILTLIAVGETAEDHSEVAAAWLYEAHMKEVAIGNYYDHDRDEGYWKEPGAPRRVRSRKDTEHDD